MLTHSHLYPSSLAGSLSHPLSHTTSLSILLVCTHSNCVSSYLVTHSGTLPSLHVCHTHTWTHRKRSAPAHRHVGYYLIKSDVCTSHLHYLVSQFNYVYFIASFVDNLHYVLSCCYLPYMVTSFHLLIEILCSDMGYQSKVIKNYYYYYS